MTMKANRYQSKHITIDVHDFVSPPQFMVSVRIPTNQHSTNTVTHRFSSLDEAMGAAEEWESWADRLHQEHAAFQDKVVELMKAVNPERFAQPVTTS